MPGTWLLRSTIVLAVELAALLSGCMVSSSLIVLGEAARGTLNWVEEDQRREELVTPWRFCPLLSHTSDSVLAGRSAGGVAGPDFLVKSTLLPVARFLAAIRASSEELGPTVLIRGRSLLSAALVWRRGEPTDAGALICPRFLVVGLRTRETTGGSDGSLGGAGVFFDFSPLSSTSSSGWDGGSSYSSSTLVSDPKPWKGGESGPVSMNFSGAGERNQFRCQNQKLTNG